MKSSLIRIVSAVAAIAATTLIAPASAQNASSAQNPSLAATGQELPPYLQCVPFAREQTGVQIFGDAHTWWGQAKGRYQRGQMPRVGAVMAFQPHRNMRLGHVAAVMRLVDDRTVLLSHSNWSPINGRRGQIERQVRAIDVSPGNDWSQVRVWYHPLQALGGTAWPIHGFIYNERSNGRAALSPTRIARAAPPAPVRARPQPVRTQSSAAFLNAFSGLSVTAAPRASAPAQQAGAPQIRVTSAPARSVRQRPDRRMAARNPQRPADSVSAALARYE